MVTTLVVVGYRVYLSLHHCWSEVSDTFAALEGSNVVSEPMNDSSKRYKGKYSVRIRPRGE